MVRYRLHNGARVRFTAEEEAARDAEEAAAPEREEVLKDAAAVSAADAVIGRALLRLIWDQEQRLRALGAESALVPVRGAATEVDFTAAVVAYIRGLM